MPGMAVGEPVAAASLPPAGELLLQGGDGRIALDPKTGLNRYGCGPLPRPDLLAFGSSTASTVSERGFAAASRLHGQLQEALSHLSVEAVYARETDRVRAELLELCGIAHLPGLTVAIAASGTDLHGLAARWACRADPASSRIVMMDPDETGCGVPAALAPSDAEGVGLTPAVVRLRNHDGSPRPQSEVDDEVESLVADHLRHGRRVLLVSLDVSKGGLLSPSLACVEDLRQRFADRLEVLVDACQFRIATASLCAYLQRGFMVAMTGSKFLAGPSFSAALLIPGEAYRALDWRPDPVPQANFGLLLRWEAALAEFRAFKTLPEAAVGQFLKTFAEAVQDRLADDPFFMALPAPSLERKIMVPTPSWDSLPSIFPFLLRPGPAKPPLDRQAVAWIYRGLLLEKGEGAGQLACQLGQPLACGSRSGRPVGALRLCASARTVVEGAADAGRRTAQVIGQAMAALDKARWLAARLGHGLDIHTNS